jgi:hypothetical protein
MNARVALLTAAALVSPVLAGAQQPESRIEGRVSAPDGTVLPGVVVRLRSGAVSGTRTYATDSRGRYRALSLPFGSYSLTAELAGFVPSTQSVALSEQQPAVTADFNLAFQPLREVVLTGWGDPPIDVGASTAPLASALFKPLPLGRSYSSTFVGSPLQRR